MGTTASAISMASLVGPVFANAVFSASMRGNYLVASVIAVIAALLSVRGVRGSSSLKT